MACLLHASIIITDIDKYQRYIINEVIPETIVTIYNNERTHFALITQSRLIIDEDIDIKVITQDDTAKWIDFCDEVFGGEHELSKTRDVNISVIPQFKEYANDDEITFAQHYDWDSISSPYNSSVFVVGINNLPISMLESSLGIVNNFVRAYIYKHDSPDIILVCDPALTCGHFDKCNGAILYTDKDDIDDRLDTMFTPGADIMISDPYNLSSVTSLDKHHRLVNYVIYKPMSYRRC